MAAVNSVKVLMCGCGCCQTGHNVTPLAGNPSLKKKELYIAALAAWICGWRCLLVSQSGALMQTEISQLIKWISTTIFTNIYGPQRINSAYWVGRFYSRAKCRSEFSLIL